MAEQDKARYRKELEKYLKTHKPAKTEKETKKAAKAKTPQKGSKQKAGKKRAAVKKPVEKPVKPKRAARVRRIATEPVSEAIVHEDPVRLEGFENHEDSASAESLPPPEPKVEAEPDV